MVEFTFENEEDQELLDKVIVNLNTQIDKGINDLDKRMKDLLACGILDEIRSNIDYITLSRFNLMITKEYINSELSFRTFDKYSDHVILSVRKTIMKMLSECDNFAERIIDLAFSGAFKYQYSKLFMNNPDSYFDHKFFTVVEEAIYLKKGTLI